MKSIILLTLFIPFGFIGCTKKGIDVELEESWTLFGYENIEGQVNCQYDVGDVVWLFEDNNLKINGRLISPLELVPCYKVEPTYTKNLEFSIIESDEERIIDIEELNLRAKIHLDEDLIIEVISSSDFYPSREGARIIFKKL